tara:strand:- start:51610 stop:51906 length:297 start_codon:yes stop_codon:yes gene_type:complete
MGKKKDGQLIMELPPKDGQSSWDKHKDELTGLELHIDGQIITLPDNMEYIQGKTASCSLGDSNAQVEIESRYIGVILGNNIIKVRVDEKTKNIKIEIE